MRRDPVCGMTVGEGSLLTADGYPEFGFCSEMCRRVFVADPQEYVAQSPVREVDIAAETDSVPGDVVVRPAPAQSIRLSVEGMTCASCGATIERSLRGVPGVVDARVNLATEEAVVDVTAGAAGLEQLVAAVTSAGYHARPAVDGGDDAQQEARQRLFRTLIHKFWFAAAVSLPVIYFSYPEIFPGVPDKGSSALDLIWGGMAVLTLAALAWSGSQLLPGAWGAFRHRSANMHTLIATGISAAWLYSTVAVLFPGFFPDEMLRDVFYDVTAVVTALVVLGMALELKARARTSEAMKKRIGLQAKTARVVRDGDETDVPVEEVVVGDVVVVRPGGKIPAGGQGRSGASAVDEWMV